MEAQFLVYSKLRSPTALCVQACLVMQLLVCFLETFVHEFDKMYVRIIRRVLCQK